MITIYDNTWWRTLLHLLVAKALADQKKFYKEKGINPIAQFVPILGSGVIFSTMFFALRGMTSCPVQSMKVSMQFLNIYTLSRIWNVQYYDERFELFLSFVG